MASSGRTFVSRLIALTYSIQGETENGLLALSTSARGLVFPTQSQNLLLIIVSD